MKFHEERVQVSMPVDWMRRSYGSIVSEVPRGKAFGQIGDIRSSIGDGKLRSYLEPKGM